MSVTRQYSVEHLSRFEYTHAVRRSLIVLRLHPRTEEHQRVLSFSLEIEPRANPVKFVDSFGNTGYLCSVIHEHSETVIRSRFQVEMTDRPQSLGSLAPGAWDRIAETAAAHVYWDYLAPSAFVRATPALNSFISAHAIERGDDPLAALRNAAATIYREFSYTPGSTQVDSPIDHVLETGDGVCQDYTHVILSIGRNWGIPSRYVSGYLHPEGLPGEQVPAGESHAWAEFLLPEIGWVGLDPTNDTVADHRHVRLAAGRDYADVPPTKGIEFTFNQSTLSVEVTITDRSSGAADQ